MVSLFIGSLAIAAVLLRVLALPRTAEAFVAATLAGLCIQSAILLVIASYDLVIAQIASIVIALCGVAYAVFRLVRGRSFVVWPRFDAARGFIETVSIAAVVVAFAAILISARAPVTSWDAGVAHLALPAEYAREGRIVPVAGNNYFAYPHLVHTLFAVAPGALEKEAAQVTWLFGLLLCGSAYFLARRIGCECSAAIAPAIIATTPLFIEQCGVPGIDVPYTATVLGALCAAAAWKQEGRIGWLVLAGVLAGSGCGIRHTAYLVNALLFAGVPVIAQERRLQKAGLFLLVMTAGAAPWLLRTWLVCGNPIYPFFSSAIGSAVPDVDVAALGVHSSIQGSGLLQLVMFPWSLTMQPTQYGGWSTSPGALWLVLGVVGACIGGSGAQMLGAFGVAGLVAIFFFQRFARYAFPFLAPLMVVAALPFEKAPALRRVIVPALLLSYAFGLAPSLAGAAMKLPAAFGVESRETFLSEHVERYHAMAWVAASLPEDAIVLSLDPRGYYFNRTTHTNFEALKSLSHENYEAQLEWLRENRVGYLFYPEKYVTESPAFRVTGVGAMVDAWRADSGHFMLKTQFQCVNPRDGGPDWVEIYELRL